MEEAEREPTLRDYGRVLRRRKWIVVLAVLSVVGVALVLTVLTTPVYEAEAQMLVQPRSTDTLFDPSTGQRNDPTRALQTEIQVLKSDPVQEQVKTALKLKTDPPKVSASPIGQTDVVAVHERSTDPKTAQVVANAYVNAYIDFRRKQSVGDLLAASQEVQSKVDELQRQIDSVQGPDQAAQRQALIEQQSLFKQKLDQLQVDAALRTGGAQLVRPAALPSDPVEPRPLRTLGLALLIGVLLGVAGAFLVDYLDDSIKGREDLERAAGSLPVLAVIPIDPPPDHRPIAVSRPDDPAVEAYRTLRTSVQFLGIEKPLKVLQVTSPIQAEGKTTTIANLAVMLARAGSRVALVDGDLRRPLLHTVFAVDDTTGLTNALLGTPTEDVLRPTFEDHVTVLPAGPVPPNPSELLGSKRMASLVADLAERFDVVLIDSPPVLPVSDAMVLTAAVDGVLVVVQAKRTTTKQLDEAIRRLGQVSAPVLGLVLNRLAGGDAERYAYQRGSPYTATKVGTDLPPAPAGKRAGSRGRGRQDVTEPTHVAWPPP
jgi:succinoglycan biosynthesis transport protein ExoP